MKKYIRGLKDHHKGRDDLTGEHHSGDLGQLILLVIFMGIWITDSFLFHYSTMLSQIIPVYIHLSLAILFLILSGYMAGIGLYIVFVEERSAPAVIDKSVFSFVRHPIYLASILFYLGLDLLTLSLSSFGFTILISIFYNYIASYEETRLEERFGKEYAAYRNRVPKWIPRLSKINQ
ncbi:MAG: isoprenylcysteine carboxylmethyltransferase family protein [Spirochaetes bacterium]|nr:isoprenylcysteine carboxylmethyltransferase family protein [Spirochaetota bacterium]